MADSSDSPSLTLPSSEQVTGDGTIAVTGASYTDSFAQSNPGAMYLSISDDSGLLSAWYPAASGGGETAVSGSGSNAITFQGSYVDVEDIINSLTYAATTANGSDTISYDIWNQAGVQTTGSVPVTISGTVNSGGPALTEPSSESVVPTGTILVPGTYADSFAASNPGSMYLSISDSTGTLYADYDQVYGEFADKVAAPGSGSNTITFQGPYWQVTEILNTLSYVAGGNAGSDAINFELWNQAGVETTGSVAVAVATGGGGGGGTITWTGDVSSDWNTAANWSSGTVPTGGDTVVIPGNTAYNATLANTVLSGETITLANSSAYFTDVTLGAGSLLDGTNSALRVGGTLTIASGATYAPTGELNMFRLDNTAPTTVVNDGMIATTGTAYVGLGDNLVNNGTLSLNGGHIQTGTLVNNGAVLDYGGGLEVDGTIVGGTIDLSGGGSLQLAAQNGLVDGVTIAGFSQHSEIAVFQPIDGLAFTDGELNILVGSTVVESAHLTGALTLGNFEIVHSINRLYSDDSAVYFVASNQPYGMASDSQTADISAPATGTVATDGTLALNDVTLTSGGTMTLSITAQTGALFMDGASGSGTNHLTISAETPLSQINADLASLTYVGGANPNLDTVELTAESEASPGGTIETSRYIPISVAPRGATTITWNGGVSSDWNTAANWSSDTVPTSGDTVVIAVSKPNPVDLSNATLTGEHIILVGAGFSSPILNFTNVTLDSTVESYNAGLINIAGTLTIGPQGTLLADAAADMTLTGTAETIVNNGLINTVGGGHIDIYDEPLESTAAGTLVNNGSIVLDGGGIALGDSGTYPGDNPQWMVLNAGSITAFNGGSMLLDGTLSGGNIDFAGTASLTLEQSAALTDGATVSGFAAGDEIVLLGSAWGTLAAYNNGTLDIGTGGSIATIPLTGTYALGNFEDVANVGGPNQPSVIAYAPSGGASGVVGPEIVAPADGTVAQGTSLVLNDVSITAQGGGTIDPGFTVTATIDAGSGTLSMNGATGSGTNQLTVAGVSPAQLNADLASLVYVPAAGASSDIIKFDLHPETPNVSINTLRYLPVSITPASNGPALNEPASESVAPGGSVAVAGSYSDSFAQGNPGQLYIGISDSSGTLTAANAAGQTVAASGTNSIGLSADYVDVNAILSSLHYTAGNGAGSDTIQFDIWNQAGHETMGSTAVTVTPSSNAAMGMADFAPPATASGTQGPGSSSGSIMLTDTPTHPIGVPLPSGQ